MSLGTGKQPTSFRLDPQTVRLIKELAERWGVSQPRVIELLVEEAVREGRQLRAVKEEG